MGTAPRLTILTSLWLAVIVVITAQDTPPPTRQQPTFRAGTQSVRVDLYVTKDGKPVTDLRADEIELFEDGTPHTIQTFERIAVGLQFHPDGQGVALALAGPLLHRVDAVRDSRQHLHMMADLVGNDVRLSKIARRAESRIEVPEE